MTEATQTDHQSISGHLLELRNRLIQVAIVWVVMVAIAWFGAPWVMDHLKALAGESVDFVQLTPGEVFLTSFRLAIALGTGLASPVILYHLLRFILPGLRANEKQFVLGTVLFGGVLFLCGVVFADWLVMPPTLGFLLGYGQTVAQTQLSIARYVDFCGGMLLLVGVMFELPVVLVLLAATGLVKSSMLTAQWRSMVVGLLVLAAVLTPSQDPITLLIVAGALLGLYGVSLIPIRLIERGKQRSV